MTGSRKTLRRTRYRWKRCITEKKRYNNKEFVIKRYDYKTGRSLDLEPPVRYSEKVQWLKLHYNNPLYAVCADKAGVKDYIADKGYADILNRTIGIYSSADEINLDALPSKFVIKATHGSGWNLICDDKKKIRRDWPRWKRVLDHWLSQDYSLYGREMHYSMITPRLICEEFLENEDGSQIRDYKFLCFGGEPKIIIVDYDRFSGHTRNYYDADWKLQDIKTSYLDNYPITEDKPVGFERMLRICRDLSRDFPAVRVDFYVVGGKLYFGEMTFYDNGGFLKYEPDEFDFRMGEWLSLPDKDSPFVIM